MSVFASAVAFLLGSVLFGPVAKGSPSYEEPLFSISKSENKNEVAYTVRVDSECRPIGAAPVVAYWRMFEQSATAVEPLSALEKRAYGVGVQQILERQAEGGIVELTLRAIPSRQIVVRTSRRGSVCAAEAFTRIGDRAARLYGIYARIAWPFGVSSIEISGWADGDGRVVRETVRL